MTPIPAVYKTIFLHLLSALFSSTYWLYRVTTREKGRKNVPQNLKLTLFKLLIYFFSDISIYGLGENIYKRKTIHVMKYHTGLAEFYFISDK